MSDPIMPNHSTSLLRTLALVALLLPLAGCAGKNLINWKKDSFPQADERNPVRKMVCIWEPVEGQGLDGLPTRGFAGQIMFFTHGSPAPVASDGEVMVYLYHDRGTPEEQAKPLHQFSFSSEAWSKHLQKSTPGPSYRIFIPYVAKHSWHVNCGLRVRLTTPQGQPVYSEMVYVRLPGATEKTSEADPNSPLASLRPKPEISEFQLGASLNHRRGPAAGVVSAEQADIIKRALGAAAAAEYLEPAGPDASAGTILPASAEQAAEFDDGEPVQPADDARIRQLEAMLQQLKHQQPQQPRQPQPTGQPQAQHPLAADEDPQQQAPPRRFKLSLPRQTAGGSPHAPGRHPLDDSPPVAHPLEGF
jgi:hypothetical protein